MTDTEPRQPQDNPEVFHEPSDANVPAILGFGLGLAVLAAVVLVGLYFLLQWYQGRVPRADVPDPSLRAESQPPPEPRLQISPAADLAKLRAAEEEQLGNYGWVDREKQLVRIPIERAMQLLAERGLPARKPPDKKRQHSDDPKAFGGG